MSYGNAIYIPIWLYSNLEKAVCGSHLKEFTFQSGYIQIYFISSRLNSPSNIYIPIWLYSNAEKIGEIPVVRFTFQSGYIQIVVECFTSKKATPFTFQSGYIQIQTDLLSTFVSYQFTFQSGYIQISLARLLKFLFK